MKNEIAAALIELAAGPFLRLRQTVVYRALGIRAPSTLVLDLIGAAARVLAPLSLWVALPTPVVLASLVIIAWAALVALAEITMVLVLRSGTDVTAMREDELLEANEQAVRDGNFDDKYISEYSRRHTTT